MEEQIIALCDAVCVSDKRYGLKIVGKPCEGKPHARFDEGLLGRLYGRTSGLLYNISEMAVKRQLVLFPICLQKHPNLSAYFITEGISLPYLL